MKNKIIAILLLLVPVLAYADSPVLGTGKTANEIRTILSDTRIGYTEPATNLPLCRTGSAETGGCTNLKDVAPFFSFVISAPAEADDINVFKAPYAITIVSISCIVQGTTSVTGQLQACSETGTDCGDIDGSDIVCDADGAADDGTITAPTIAANAWIRWKTASVVDTPTFLTVTVKYTP